VIKKMRILSERKNRTPYTLFRGLVASVGAGLGVLFFIMTRGSAAALTAGETGLRTTATNAGLNTATSIPQYVGSIISAILGIIGVVFLILIVYGGMQWMLAQGEEKKVGDARGLIFHAIIGLILVFSAYAISNFVVGALISQAIK